jgi:hypothetical protein
MQLPREADYDPFDVVTLTRIRDDNGEPTDLVEIEGLRQGGMRSRIVRSRFGFRTTLSLA